MLAPKILQVDAFAAHDQRVVEVHPECSFRELAGRPLASKHSAEGQQDRRTLLAEVGIHLPTRVQGIPELDLLDAVAAAWSADRYARGLAEPLPPGHEGRIGAIWR
jgi:predicted RNase H-like nuclease